jgi:hypothetical protein
MLLYIKPMKKKTAKIIQILGIGLHELVMDLELSFGTFNSIEWSKEENKIYLHIFNDFDDSQLTFDYDDLDREDKLEIYILLASITYN